ncbi:phosphotransferase family protein [Sciscionella marina]|uniref:phosphotransferase family protein n=1 Tax=Sciscionella marina TaxID=508770 RepID=UPI00036AD8D9|nr:phosphotransferase [Sciscionella marina]
MTAPIDDAETALLATAGLRGNLSARPLDGGFSNHMRTVTDGERTVVLRRWKGGADAARTELAALREAAADGIPVPGVLAAEADRAVLALVPGELASTVLPRATRAQAETIGERIGAVFATVWDRPREVAGEAKRGTDPLEFTPWPIRPAELFEQLLERITAAPPGWVAMAADYAETMNYLLHRPVRSHSDANPKNILLRREGKDYTVAALLDWEFTCAAPLEHDLGNLLRFERLGSVPGPFGNGIARGSGCDREQITLGRRLDLFAIAELFSRENIEQHGMYRVLYELAERQLRTPL